MQEEKIGYKFNSKINFSWKKDHFGNFGFNESPTAHQGCLLLASIIGRKRNSTFVVLTKEKWPFLQGQIFRLVRRMA